VSIVFINKPYNVKDMYINYLQPLKVIYTNIIKIHQQQCNLNETPYVLYEC